jgi:16S rRNA processing protein RimM
LTRAPVAVGVVFAAHGIGGEVKVKSFTADPLALGSYGRRFAITSLRHHRADELIMRLSGVDTRSAAEALKGERLYIPREALPDPETGEYYHADLVGLRAETADGSEFGRISAVLNYGAGDILEITRADGDTELVPFSNNHVPVVDIAAGRVVIELPLTDE